VKDFTDTTGFITGGASGIGLAMARALGQRGMRVMLADIEADTLARAEETLRAEGIQAQGTELDVGDAGQGQLPVQQRRCRHPVPGRADPGP